MIISVIIIAVSWIIKDENSVDCLKPLKKDYTLNYWGLSGNSGYTILFALISMYLQYLCEPERETPQELKDSIYSFIKSDAVESGTKIFSWKALFHKFSENFPVEYIDFIDDFVINENYLNYHLDGPFAYWVVLDERYATDWFVSNKLNNVTFNMINLDFACENQIVKQCFLDIKNECFDLNKNFLYNDHNISLANR